MVFEAGGGEDSSVWAELGPAVRARNGVRTMVYDRAGLGRSRPNTPPYRIDDEADALPLIEAYPATVERLRQVDIPAATPTIDIVAERTWVETPEEIEAIRRVHREFVAASPHRRAVVAEGSGHHVMHDRPDVVLAAVEQLVVTVRVGSK